MGTKRCLWLWFLPILLVPQLTSSAVHAQYAPNPVQKFFNGITDGVRSAIPTGQWNQLPPRQAACVNTALSQQGRSIDQLARSGIGPADPRLGQLMANCRNLEVARANAAQQWSTVTAYQTSCVNERIAPQQTSISALIDKGVGPSDARISQLISECRADEANNLASQQAQQSAAQADEQSRQKAHQIADRAREKWRQLSGSTAICIDTGLATKGLMKWRLAEDGIGPDDPSIAAVRTTCSYLTGLSTRTNVECRLTFDGVQITTMCDESYTIANGGAETNILNFESAVGAAFDNQVVISKPFERPDARSRRSQMQPVDLAYGRVPVPSFNCAQAKTSNEYTICSSYKLSILDQQYAGYWKLVQPLDKRGDATRDMKKAFDARNKCQSNETCIADILIRNIDILASFLKSHGIEAASYAELQDMKQHEDSKKYAEIVATARADAERVEAQRKAASEAAIMLQDQTRQNEERRLAIANAEAEKAKAEAERAKAESDRAVAEATRAQTEAEAESRRIQADAQAVEQAKIRTEQQRRAEQAARGVTP